MKFPFRKGKLILTPEEKKRRNKDRLLLVLSGIFLGISFPPFPFPFQLFMLIGLIPYFSVIERKETLGDLNRATYLTAFVFGLITIYWVGSWQKEADPFLMISGGLLLFVNPVFFLIPSTLLYFSRKIFKSNISIYFFPLFWVTYEYVYMLTDLSFPWLTLGNGLSHFTTFIQIADIIGALGLSVLVIYINLFAYKSLINFRIDKKAFYKNILITLILFVIPLVYGIYRISTFKISDTKVKIGLIQPDIDPWNKWEAGNIPELTHEYLEMSRKAVDEKVKIVVWPETALPVFLLSGQYPDAVDSIYNFVNKNNVYLITGMPDIHYYSKNQKKPSDVKYNKTGDYYYTTFNAVLLFSPGVREIQRYRKMKLVPFGEKVPFADKFPFLGKLIKWGVGITGWNVGKDTTNFEIPLYKVYGNEYPTINIDTLKINSLVCYESIYPDFVAQFVQRGADLITVVTNDSWYGKSSGPYQHKEISVLRAVENRRTVLRAANGGISCMINALGKTEIQTKLFTRTYLVVDAPIQTEETYFTKHPLVIPVLVSAFSFWIIGIFILKILKVKLKI